MKAVILSGGSGVRLAPLSNTITKQLLPVAGQPSLFHILERIKTETPIKEVCIVVSEEFGHQVKEYILNSKYTKDFEFSFIVQDKPLGLAHAVQITSMHIGYEPFLMFLGDIIIEKGEVKNAYEKFIKNSPDCLVFLNKIDDPRPYGVAEVEGDKVLKLIEKPQDPKSNLCLSGIYLFKPSIFYAIANIKPSYRGELEITDAVDYLIQNNHRVEYYEIKGYWFDVGTPENMLDANKVLLSSIKKSIHSEIDSSVKISGNVIIEENVLISNSEIIGPVIISRNAHIKNSKIGPNVTLGDSVEIEGSTISNSILNEGCKIINLNSEVVNSLIGKRVEMVFSKSSNGKVQYVLGDSTKCMSL